MKVCLISFSHHSTLQNYMYLLKKNLVEQGIEVISIGNKDIKTQYDTLDENLFVECEDNASPSINNIKLYKKNKKTIIEYIKKKDPDKILFISKHIWNALLVASLDRKKYKIYHVFHDPIGHAGTKVQKGVYTYNKAMSYMLSGIIVHSDTSYNATKNIIKPKCGIKKVPLGEKIWLDYKKPGEYKKNLLLFGRISTYKGCEFIPELSKKLQDKKIECRITIAGKVMSDVDKTLLDEINNCSQVDLINEIIPEDKLDQYFNEADACLILHKSISQSGVIIDAYRHSKPIICFNIDGIEEFITAETAYIVKPYDIEDLCSKIKDMYDNYDKYSKMTNEAYKHGKEIFSDKKMATEIKEYLMEN